MGADPPEISRCYEQKCLLEEMLGPKKGQKTQKQNKKSTMGKGLVEIGTAFNVKLWCGLV